MESETKTFCNLTVVFTALELGNKLLRLCIGLFVDQRLPIGWITTKLIWKPLHITRDNQDSLTCCLQGHVVMGTQAPSVYQQVIEKTKGVMSRTQELARNIEKRLNIDKAGYEVS